jgi:hypothetical protein
MDQLVAGTETPRFCCNSGCSNPRKQLRDFRIKDGRYRRVCRECENRINRERRSPARNPRLCDLPTNPARRILGGMLPKLTEDFVRGWADAVVADIIMSRGGQTTPTESAQRWALKRAA